MQLSEKSPLLSGQNGSNGKNGLSLLFTVICIVDVFGVFPVVTLSKAVLDCGLLGIIVVLIVCSIQIYTAILLGRCWIMAQEIHPEIDYKNRYPYAALTELTFGKFSSNIVTILVDVTVFGCSIPNLILASKNLELLGSNLSNGEMNIPFCYWIILLGMVLCPILWLGSPKDMKFLCTLSVFIVLAVFLLINISVLFDTSNTSQNINVIKPETWKSAFIAFGIIAFQFDIHPTILTIQVDMIQKTKLGCAILGAFLGSLFMFFVTYLNIYMKYGHLEKPSILEDLPITVPLHIASALVAIQLCLTSAISNSALYQHMEDCLNISRDFNNKRCVLRTILSLLAIIIAESVPRFDIVMSLIGSTLTAPLMFVLPSLFYIKIIKLQDDHQKELAVASFKSAVYTDDEADKRMSEVEKKLEEDFNIVTALKTKNISFINRKVEYFLCILIICFSIFCTIGSTYFNVIDTIYNEEFSSPCIYNISTTLIEL